MVVSFKIARKGARPRPRTPPYASADEAEASTPTPTPTPKGSAEQAHFFGLRDGTANLSVLSTNYENNHVGVEVCFTAEQEASFCLKLFSDGFFIGKPTEGVIVPLREARPKMLHPYDRRSKTLISEIEHGWLPRDILDDIACKFFNGCVFCEVLDYRSCRKYGKDDCFRDDIPEVQKACLRMTTETVIRDIASISDDSWTYNDLLQAEARVTKALHPVLHLGTDPSLDRLCATGSKQLDLGIEYEQNQARKQQSIPEINTNSPDLSHGREISSNGHLDKSQNDQEILHTENEISRSNPCDQQNHTGNGLPIVFSPYYNSKVSCPFSLPIGLAATSDSTVLAYQNLRNSCIGTIITENRNGHMADSTPAATVKTPKLVPIDFNFCASVNNQRDALPEQELQWKAISMQKRREAGNTHRLRLTDQNDQQLGTIGMVGTYPVLTPQMPSQSYNQGVQHSFKEPTDVEMKKDVHDSNIRSEKFNQRSPLSHPIPLPPQIQWINTGPSGEKFTKEKVSQKRKLSLGPQIVAGDVSQSLAFRVGVKRRMSSGDPCSKSPVLIGNLLQKNKDSLTPASVGITFPNPSFNKSLLQENQKPGPKTKYKRRVKVTSQSMTEAECPAVANGSNTFFGLERLSVGTRSMQLSSGAIEDQAVIERFSKIKMVVERHGLIKPKKGTNQYPMRKPLSNLCMPPIHLLLPVNNEGCETLGGKNCMSKCLIDGSRNTFKTRTLIFLHERRSFRGQCVPSVFINPIKLVLSESDLLDEGSVRVEIIYGDEGSSFLTTILPNPNLADMFAAQFTSLMEREGYKLDNDQLQPTPASDPDPFDSTSADSCSQEFSEPQDRFISEVTDIGNCIPTMSSNQAPPSFMQHHYNSACSTNLKMGSQMPSNITRRQLSITQSQWVLFQQQLEATNRMMANLRTASNVSGLGGGVSCLNTSHVNNNPLQDSSFGKSCPSEAQVGRSRQVFSPGMFLTDRMPAIGITESRTFLDQVVESSYTSPTTPSRNLSGQRKKQQNHQWHQQRHSSHSRTEMSRTSPMSQRSSSQNARGANVGSSETFGSGGSITSLPLQHTRKRLGDGDAGFFDGCDGNACG